MYRSARLYPNNYDGLREHLYVTQSVKARIRGLRQELNRHSIKFNEFAAMMDYSVRGVMNIINVRYYPFIKTYLRIAELMEWKLARDVNYCYAQVVYLPDEIRRRVMRLFPITKTLNGACFLLEREIGWDIATLKHTVLYGKRRCSVCYGMMMHYIMKQERVKGYPDALDLEE